MNTIAKSFIFIIITVFPIFLHGQNDNLGDDLIIKNHPKADELFLKLKLPNYWDAKESKFDEFIKILYNKNTSEEIHIKLGRLSRHYTRSENIAYLNKTSIKQLFSSDMLSATPQDVEVISQSKFTIDSYPAIKMRAKVQTKSNSGEQILFYRTYISIFHKGLAIRFIKNSENSNNDDEQLLSLITSSITFPNRDTDEQLEGVICKICSDVIGARQNALDIPKWEETMRKYYGYTGSSKNFSQYFNDFLNKNNQRLICPRFQVTTNIYPPQHLFKRILAAGMNETYEEYFFNFENGDVDFNAYQIIDGKKETILDWALKWVEQGRGDSDELLDITSALEDEFGAKYGRDLHD